MKCFLLENGFEIELLNEPKEEDMTTLMGSTTKEKKKRRRERETIVFVVGFLQVLVNTKTNKRE